MITTAQMQALETKSEQEGTSKLILMQRAGEAIATILTEIYPNATYLFVCGTGNNGGDGFTAANILHSSVLFKGDPTKLPKEAKTMYDRLPQSTFVQNITGYDILVDCLLGTGINGILREPARSLIEELNVSTSTIVSCDVPSGLHPDTGEIRDIAVVPTLTICLHDVKQGLATKNLAIITADIGL